MSKIWRCLIALIVTTIIAIGTTAFAAAVWASNTLVGGVGDSYAAGWSSDANKWQLPNNVLYDPTTRQPGVDECGRNSQSALQLATQMKGYPAPQDVTCAGATTDNLLTIAQWPGKEAPQIGRLSPNLYVVYSLIGGNDIGFSKIVTCVLLSNCSATSQEVTEARRILRQVLPSKLDQVYHAIQARAPNARVLASDYPPILPSNPSGLWLCGLYMSPQELSLVQSILDELNSTIHAAADRNGVTYVDTSAAWAGHDLVGLTHDACSPSAASGAWQIRLITPDGLPGILTFSWHPTAAGARYSANAIAPHL